MGKREKGEDACAEDIGGINELYKNMEQKCEKQGSNHALTEAISSEAAELQNRVKS